METRGSYQQAHLGRRDYNGGQRRQPACAALGVDTVELVGKTSAGDEAGVWVYLYRWGNDKPRGWGGLTAAAGGGE
jgi:hypothetical protein